MGARGLRTSWCAGPRPGPPPRPAPPRPPGPPPPLPPASRSHFLLEPPAAAAAPSSPAAGRAPGEARRGPAGWGSGVGALPAQSGRGRGRGPRKFACGRPRAGGAGIAASWAGAAAGRGGHRVTASRRWPREGGFLYRGGGGGAAPARRSCGGPLRSEGCGSERKVSEVGELRAGLWDSEVGCPPKLVGVSRGV